MSTSASSGRRARLLSVMLLMAVFMTGGLVGAVVTSSAFAGGSPAPTEADMGSGLADLELSAEQQDAVDAIMATYQPTADSIARSSIARLQSLLDDVDADVRSILTREQLAQYDEMRSTGPRVRAVRRTVGPSGTVVVDTIGR